MTIGKKLIFASVVSFALFALLAATGYMGYRSALRSTKAADALDRESMCLQMLFRGVNESLLTNGTSYSVQIIREAVSCFDDAHALAIVSEPDRRGRLQVGGDKGEAYALYAGERDRPRRPPGDD